MRYSDVKNQGEKMREKTIKREKDRKKGRKMEVRESFVNI